MGTITRANLPLTFGIVLTAVFVALLYSGFEHIVKHAIPYVWDTAYDNSPHWNTILLLSVGLGLLYFAAQHFLDRKSEQHESHGLGDTPPASIRNLLKVLSIGFLSLLAGATLGVESILVPASVMTGAYLSAKLYAGEKTHAQALAAAGFIALFTAFFHSFIMGILALYLLSKTQGVKLTMRQFVVAILASLTTLLTLSLLPSENQAYLELPNKAIALNGWTILAAVLLAAAGYITTYGIKFSHDVASRLTKRLSASPWWQHALLASVGIALLYSVGGKYVWFTGNQAIVPVLQDAPSLGVWALGWIALIKILAVGWSKALIYRGGLVFPLVFIASTYVAMLTLYQSSINFHVALIAVMFGAFVANNKLRVLF